MIFFLIPAGSIANTSFSNGNLSSNTVSNSKDSSISNSQNRSENSSAGPNSVDDFNIGYCKIFVGGLHYDTRDGMSYLS
jgi:hypothetical protein